MNLNRQELLLKKLLQYRFRNYNLSLVKVEVYDTFEGDQYMCRVEIFKGGIEITHRILKHEDYLNATFAKNITQKLVHQLSTPSTSKFIKKTTE